MKSMKWDTFQAMLDAANGEESSASADLGEAFSGYDIIAEKQNRLLAKQKSFKQASEKNILKEYRKMREAHTDYMKTLHKVQRESCY